MSNILIASERVFPKVAEQTGYVFEHSDLGGALNDVINPVARPSAA